MDERPAIVVDLPTSVHGFVFHDDDGECFIVVNARLTREANVETWIHEKTHILRGDLDNISYLEYLNKETS